MIRARTGLECLEEGIQEPDAFRAAAKSDCAGVGGWPDDGRNENAGLEKPARRTGDKPNAVTTRRYRGSSPSGLSRTDVTALNRILPAFARLPFIRDAERIAARAWTNRARQCGIFPHWKAPAIRSRCYGAHKW